LDVSVILVIEGLLANYKSAPVAETLWMAMEMKLVVIVRVAVFVITHKVFVAASVDFMELLVNSRQQLCKSMMSFPEACACLGEYCVAVARIKKCESPLFCSSRVLHIYFQQDQKRL